MHATSAKCVKNAGQVPRDDDHKASPFTVPPHGHPLRVPMGPLPLAY